ncbi:MAG TPA: hypothetical protein PLB25_03310 [Rhodoferax sp.]|nr:hypothetical protein [Rhodoferax sp.]
MADFTIGKSTVHILLKLRGILPQPKQAGTVEEMNQAVQDAATEKTRSAKPVTPSSTPGYPNAGT